MKKLHLTTAVLAAASLGSILVYAQTPLSKPGGLHLFVSNGVREVVQAIRPQAERPASPWMMEFGTSALLKQKIESGEAFDVAILTTDLIEDLAKKGKIVPGTVAGIARAGMGVGIRAGATKPDIRTADAMKRMLVNAKSITYAQEGASRAYVEKMFDSLGLGADFKKKIVLTSSSGVSAEKVAKGESDILLTLISEILPAPGVQLVGSVPAEFQHYISFAAGVGVNSRNMEASKTLIKTLTGPGVAPTLKEKGMEQLGK